jgi:hypothetical protein
VAWLTQALLVRLVIYAAFCQRYDVIALRCWRYSSLPCAFSAQRFTSKQRCTHRLQSPSSDALGWLRSLPLLARMLSASATAVTHQH